MLIVDHAEMHGILIRSQYRDMPIYTRAGNSSIIIIIQNNTSILKPCKHFTYLHYYYYLLYCVNLKGV